MYCKQQPCRRDGASAVECAIVYPCVLLFVLGLMVGGAGVFRYQQVAALAREGSRWAAVHGAQYAQETGNSAATASDVYNKAVLPNMVGLDTSKLSYSVTWNPDNTSPDSTVTVKITYTWVPEAFLAGPITLSSTSTTYMSY